MPPILLKLKGNIISPKKIDKFGEKKQCSSFPKKYGTPTHPKSCFKPIVQEIVKAGVASKGM